MSPKYGFWNASFFSFGKPLLIVAFLEQPIVPFGYGMSKRAKFTLCCVWEN
jgi:hypothetical protein